MGEDGPSPVNLMSTIFSKLLTHSSTAARCSAVTHKSHMEHGYLQTAPRTDIQR